MSDKDIQNIIIICTANTCRSPMAQYLMQKCLFTKNVSDVDIDSAGIRAKNGKDVSEFSYKILGDAGIDASNHSSKILTQELYDKADLILAMEKEHINVINKLRDYPAKLPDNNRINKVFLLGRWDNDCEIEDPYAMGYESYKLAFRQIEKSVLKWVNKLQ